MPSSFLSYGGLTIYSREWLTHQHRDTLSTIVGHPSLLSYVAIADGETTGRAKFELTEVRGGMPTLCSEMG